MSGTNIDFSIIPTSQIRIPGVFAEVNPDQANTAVDIQRALLIGQIGQNNTLVAFGFGLNVPFIGGPVNQVIQACGIGSQLALMYQRYRLRDPFGEVWLLPLAAHATGTSAPTGGTITITGTATGGGSLVIYIGDIRIVVGVNVGDTPTVQAAALAAAINANIPMVPVTAVAALGVVTLTPNWWGPSVNEINFAVNVLGASAGEVLPAGVTVAFVQFGGGGSAPDLAAILAAIVARTYDFICSPNADTTTLNELSAFLNDSVGRWSWNLQLYGHVFTALRGGLSALIAAGQARNNQHETIMGIAGATPAWLWAASITAQAAVSARADPGLPIKDLLIDVLAPVDASVLDPGERNSLLYAGISTYRVNNAGQVFIERLITTSQTNAQGVPDNSYLPCEAMFQLMAYLRSIRIYLQTLYGRKKLVQDGNIIPYGSNTVTSQTVKNSCIAHYNQQCLAGEMQNPDIFKTLIAAQNAGNGQVKVLLPIMLAGQLEDIFLLVQFSRP